ncbi:MAG: hypothetical protein E6R03_08905 [Hyphomicrobiaceae bacterium]|nr:MAG: hypothetical protein E6R03_08905 [Hyphomicrobiaceae bacterium]
MDAIRWVASLILGIIGAIALVIGGIVVWALTIVVSVLGFFGLVAGVIGVGVKESWDAHRDKQRLK